MSDNSSFISMSDFDAMENKEKQFFINEKSSEVAFACYNNLKTYTNGPCLVKNNYNFLNKKVKGELFHIIFNGMCSNPIVNEKIDLNDDIPSKIYFYKLYEKEPDSKRVLIRTVNELLNDSKGVDIQKNKDLISGFLTSTASNPDNYLIKDGILDNAFISKLYKRFSTIGEFVISACGAAYFNQENVKLIKNFGIEFNLINEASELEYLYNKHEKNIFASAMFLKQAAIFESNKPDKSMSLFSESTINKIILLNKSKGML